jgi:hypothetical protein
MARLGIPPHVADRVLNHQSGTISGMAAVYIDFSIWMSGAMHCAPGGAISRAQTTVVALPAR